MSFAEQRQARCQLHRTGPQICGQFIQTRACPVNVLVSETIFQLEICYVIVVLHDCDSKDMQMYIFVRDKMLISILIILTVTV